MEVKQFQKSWYLSISVNVRLFRERDKGPSAPRPSRFGGLSFSVNRQRSFRRATLLAAQACSHTIRARTNHMQHAFQVAPHDRSTLAWHIENCSAAAILAACASGRRVGECHPHPYGGITRPGCSSSRAGGAVHFAQPRRGGGEESAACRRKQKADAGLLGCH